MYLTTKYDGNTEQDALYYCSVEHIKSGQTKSYTLEITRHVIDSGELQNIKYTDWMKIT